MGKRKAKNRCKSSNISKPLEKNDHVQINGALMATQEVPVPIQQQQNLNASLAQRTETDVAFEMMEHQLNCNTKIIISLNKEINNRENLIDEKNNMLAVMKTDNGRLKAALEMLTNQSKVLGKELQQRKIENVIVHEELSKMKERNRNLAQTVKKYEEKIQVVVQKNQSLLNEMNKMKDKMESYEDESVKLRSRISTFEARDAEQVSQIKNLELMTATCRSELKARNEELDKVTKDAENVFHGNINTVATLLAATVIENALNCLMIEKEQVQHAEEMIKLEEENVGKEDEMQNIQNKYSQLEKEMADMKERFKACSNIALASVEDFITELEEKSSKTCLIPRRMKISNIASRSRIMAGKVDDAFNKLQ